MDERRRDTNRLKITPPRTRATPVTVLVAPSGRFNGSSQRCTASVTTSGPMNSSGGNGNRTAAPRVDVDMLT
jgi:hypothetical protein